MSIKGDADFYGPVHLQHGCLLVVEGTVTFHQDLTVNFSSRVEARSYSNFYGDIIVKYSGKVYYAEGKEEFSLTTEKVLEFSGKLEPRKFGSDALFMMM